MQLDDIKKIAVIGAGNMGHQIALNAAICGFKVICTDINPETLAKAKRFVGRLPAGPRDQRSPNH